MRIAAPLFVLAALAAAPALAQKPGVDDLERDAYRGRGISLCLVNVAAAEGVSADDAEAICGCALDRFMPRWPTGALPAIGTSRFQTVMTGDLLSCTAEQRPRARRRGRAPPGGAPPPAAAAPPPVAGGGRQARRCGRRARASSEESGAGLRDWWNGLTLPRWLGGGDLPLWAWVVLALFAFLFLRGLPPPPRGARPGRPAAVDAPREPPGPAAAAALTRRATSVRPAPWPRRGRDRWRRGRA